MGTTLLNTAPEKAKVYLQAALSLRPDSADVHNNLGNSYSSSNQIELAIKHYEKAMELSTDDRSIALSNLGSVLTDAGQTEQARKLLLEAVELEAVRVQAKVGD